MANPGFNQGSNALRNMRRFLQGRGVQYRRAVVDGVADPLANPITVFGLRGNDEIISVLRFIGAIVGGAAQEGISELNYRAEANAVQAVLAVAASGGGNNGYTVIAGSEYPGSKGNGATGGLTWTRTGGGAAGRGAVVSVSGRAVTVTFETGVTTVNEVIAAVERHPEARRMIDMKLSGAGPTGVGFIAAAAVANLASGVDADPENVVKVVTAAAQAVLSITGGGDHTYIAGSEYPGTKGNALTIKYLDGAALSVAVSGAAVTVTLITASTTVAEVIAAIEAHPEARRMFDVKANASGQEALAAGNDTGSGANTATSLAGGTDESVAVKIGGVDAVDLSADRLVVDYLAQVR